MAITSGDISTYASLQVVTGIFVLDIEPSTDLVFVGSANNIQPIVSLAEASEHPLTAAGVGIVNFQPNAQGGGGNVRTEGIMYP